MAVNEVTEESVRFFVKGFSRYVMQKWEVFSRLTYDDFIEDEIYVSHSLRIILQESFTPAKITGYLDEYVSYVSLEDRVNRFKSDVKLKLIEKGKTLTNAKFLRECALYVNTGAELEETGFAEASDIIIDAMYEACMETKQRQYLRLWSSETFEVIP